jgi:small GTP-binding protein
MGTDERIKEIEQQLSTTKYNKSTEHAFGVMKAQLAKLREKQEKRMASKGGGKGFFVKKSGDATVVLLGFPSVGKSSLLNNLTSSKSAVAAYAFTTLTVIPGVLLHRDAKIQILDVPGVVEGAASGRGRGKEVLAMVRTCDLILIIIDALHPEHYSVLLREIDEVGVRLNQRKPDVRIKRKDRGGLSIASTVPLRIDKKTIEAILREFRIGNADVVIRSPLSVEQFIDCLEGNKAYIPSVVVINKIDLVDEQTRKKLISDIRPDLVVSAQNGENMARLRDLLYDSLRFVRIYLKEINKKADMDVPLVLMAPVTIRAVCEHLHRDFVKKFRFARIWGPSAKFGGQEARTLDKPLVDKDVLELHMK